MSNDDINLIQMLILPQLPSASLFNFPKKISPPIHSEKGMNVNARHTHPSLAQSVRCRIGPFVYVWNLLWDN